MSRAFNPPAGQVPVRQMTNDKGLSACMGSPGHVKDSCIERSTTFSDQATIIGTAIGSIRFVHNLASRGPAIPSRRRRCAGTRDTACYRKAQADDEGQQGTGSRGPFCFFRVGNSRSVEIQVKRSTGSHGTRASETPGTYGTGAGKAAIVRQYRPL